VGSEGIHMPWRADEMNQVIPTLTSAGYVFPKTDVLGNLYSATCNQTDPNGSDPASCTGPAPLNPNYGSVRTLQYEGRAYYNALELQLSQRMNHGLQFQADFTWGKSIDTGSATLAGDAFSNSI